MINLKLYKQENNNKKYIKVLWNKKLLFKVDEDKFKLKLRCIYEIVF